jgi:hypothetical protein
MRIITEYHGWWIDNRGRRHTEWLAYDDATYDGPGAPVGSGATEAEAIADLTAKLGEDEEQPATYIIRLRQISTGHEADSMLFRGTEAEARAHAEAAIAANGSADL